MTARTLARRIVLRTTEREVFTAIRFLECTPDLPASTEADLVITIEPFRGWYRIIEPGRPVKEVLDTRSVVDLLHGRVFFHSLEGPARSGFVHAALLRRGPRRVLIAGSKGAGKTSLALRLLGAGYDVEGDEHVFLKDGGVIARPRGCRVKGPSVALLPEFADAILAAPVYLDVRGSQIFNVSPAALGGSWRIQHGKVDCVIVLQPNHGGYSSLRPLVPSVTAQALISELRIHAGDRGPAIQAVAALVSEAKGYDLSLGDYHSAVECIDRALDA